MKSHSLICPNRKCNQKLHPIGNYHYGSGQVARILRSYSLWHFPLVFILFILLQGTRPTESLPSFDGALIMVPTLILIIPIFACRLIANALPKCTTIICHKCNRKSEHEGNLINLPPLPESSLAPIDPTQVEPSTHPEKEKRRRKRSTRAERSSTYTPFTRRRRK